MPRATFSIPRGLGKMKYAIIIDARVTSVLETDASRNIININNEWNDRIWTLVPDYVDINYQYDSSNNEFIPPDWTLVDGVWTAPMKAIN